MSLTNTSSATSGKMRAGMRTASPPSLAGLKRSAMADSTLPSLNLLGSMRPVKFRKLDSSGGFKRAGVGGREDFDDLGAVRKNDVNSTSRGKLHPGGRLGRAALSTGGNPSALRKADARWRNLDTAVQSDRSQRIILGKATPNMMSLNKAWDRLLHVELFQSGKMDMDNLCSELRERAKCSEIGAVVAEEDVEDILERARLKSGTGVATSIKAGDPQDLSTDMDEGKREGNSLYFQQHLKRHHRATIGDLARYELALLDTHSEPKVATSTPQERRRAPKIGSEFDFDRVTQEPVKTHREEYEKHQIADQGRYDARSVSLKGSKAPDCKSKMFMCYTISQDLSGSNESNGCDRLKALRSRSRKLKLRNADVQGLQFRGFSNLAGEAQ